MQKISFIIVAYKSNKHLPKCLKAIIRQEGDFAKEIIVVDNYPKEPCAQLVLSITPDAHIIINKENTGFTYATNQAITAAQGEYLFFLNPDTEITDTCVNSLLTTLKSDHKIGAVVPQLISYDQTIQRSVRNFPTFRTLIYEHFGLAKIFKTSNRFNHWRNPRFDYTKESVVEQPMASAIMIPANIQQKLGKWDEQFFIFFSDVDICKRICQNGYKIIFQPKAKVYHHYGGSTKQEGSRLIFDSHFGFYKYLKKHELNGLKTILRPLAYLLLFISGVIRSIFRTKKEAT